MRSNNSIDGFVPRRPSARLEHAKNLANRQQQAARLGRPMQANIDTLGRPARPLNSAHKFTHSQAQAQGSGGLTRLPPVDESLRNIDMETPTKDKSKGGFSKKRSKLNKRSLKNRKSSVFTKKKIAKRVAIIVAVILLGIAAFVGIRAFIAGNNMFSGNILGILSQQDLKADANGRSNILIFGTAEDSEGGAHEGANLTDSIMVLSVHQKKKDAYMLSLPRDLWVQYENICTVGNQGKLNAAYYCGSGDGQNEEQGAATLQRQVAQITGLDIQYYVHVNFTVVTDSVDAVGGIDVTVESDDPRGILDRNFDWKCNYQCYYVNYKNGEKAHMDGEHALAFIRARNAQGGYGLAGGNFDRERNQQKVIVALRDKALSAGTLTSVSKVTRLIDAMGNNLRTNFATGEVRTLMSLARDIPSDSIQSLSLDDEDEPLVAVDNHNGQSIVRPVMGILMYSDIHSYVRENVAATPITRERAQIMVLNGTAIPGHAGSKAKELEDKGYKIAEVGNAPTGSYGPVEVYRIATDKPETAKSLQSLYGVEPRSGSLPLEVAEGIDFVLIYGE